MASLPRRSTCASRAFVEATQFPRRIHVVPNMGLLILFFLHGWCPMVFRLVFEGTLKEH